MAKKYLSPLNLLNLTSDPGTAAEGDFYWNSSTNRLRIYFDGAWADVSSNTAFTNDANTFTTAQTITPATSLTGLTINAASSAKGLIVKANATTPGNLQEWQDSTGTVLTNVESSGRVTSTVGYYTSGKISIGGASWSGGASMLNVWSTGTTSVPLTVRGVASQTGDLQQWQNSSGTVLMNITSGGDLGLSAIRATGGSVQRAFFDKTTESVRITPATTSHIGLVVKGIASQTANLQEWQNSAGTIVAALGAGGNVGFGRTIGSGVTTIISTGATTNVGLMIDGIASQTGDLQQWRDSSANILGKIDASGNVTAASFIKSSGTSSQFLKADGSVDSSTYLTTGTAASTYLPLTGGTISSNLTITGDLVVNGTTTNLNSTNLVIEDKNIILGDVTTPSNTTADGGGITLKGATDKTFNWVNSTGYWTSNVGIEATSFVKTSGTSSQFLKADGSIDSSTYLTTGTASSTYLPLAGGTLTGQLISTRANDATTGAGQIYLNGATGNRIDFNQNGVASPTNTTRSAGTKIVLWPNIGASTVDYAIGIEGSHMWHSVDNASSAYGFKWYASQQNVMTLRGNGTLSLNSTSSTLGNGSVTHQLGVVSGATTNVGLVVRSIASQTADLQQWQDSSGTNLVRINATGQISTSNVIVVGTLSGSIAQASIYTTGASGIGIAVRGFASQTADLQQWQNNSGTVLANITSGGDANILSTITIGTNRASDGASTINFNTVTGQGSSQASIYRGGGYNGSLVLSNFGSSSIINLNGSAASVNTIIRGAASQTGDLMQWQNSAGTDLTSIDSGGSIRFNVNSAPMIKWGTATILEGVGSTASIRINPYGSTYIGLIVKGLASQSANLQEWQNNSGTAVATMSAAGAFTAITKSFDIPHPTKENMRLRYGSLEGPENGVYVRGRSKQDYIALPDHWRGLVDEDTITVNITPVGKKQDIYVDSIEDNKVYLGGKIKEYFFTVYGERKDVDKLIVEY